MTKESQQKTWISETTKDPQNKPIWNAKLRELREDEGNLMELIDKLFIQRTKIGNADKMLASCVISRFTNYLRDCRRQIKKFEWIKKLAAGKVKEEELRIEDAKNYPIGDILNQKPTGKSNKRTFYCCPLHNEKTGSFCWYRDNNTWYCFGGCSTGGDSIDLYQKLHDVRFVEAVKALC